MKCFKITITLLIISIQTVSAQVITDYITEVNYSSNIDYTSANGLKLLHNHVAVDTIGDVSSHTSPDSIWHVRGARVDGYHQDKEGTKYFSFDSDIRFNGLLALKNDIVKCENTLCDSSTLYFDLLPNSPFNINAFTIDPENGDILFTIDNATEVIPGMPVFPSTIIRYNFSLAAYEYFHTPYADDASKNIDALTYLPNNKILYSLENDDIYNFIYVYDPLTGTNEVAYTPLSFVSNNIDITSLMAFENDLIFKNGFE